MNADVAVDVRGLGKRYVRTRPRTVGVRGVLARALGRRPAPAVAGPSSFWALRDVTFAVRRGERVGVIGRNGAGKSTLLKILSRIVSPTSGEARVRGRLNALLEIGTGFNPSLSGRENVYLNAALHGFGRREMNARIDEIARFSGVGEALDGPLRHYSSGMVVRLAFAIIAHLDPEVLLLDEVLAVGDLAFQRQCLRRMDALGREGRTILFVSHSMEAVRTFCGRCLWLDEGRIVADGPVAEVIDAYVDAAMHDGPSRPTGERPPARAPAVADGMASQAPEQPRVSTTVRDQFVAWVGGRPAVASSAGRVTLSVVISTFERRAFLKRTIESVRTNGIPVPFETLVIDGGSTDGTLEWVLAQKDVITIVQHNRGEFRGRPIPRRSWGYFMNLGFKAAQGRYILMLSDDCLLLPDAVSRGLATFERLEAAGRRVAGVAFYFRNWPDERAYYVQRTLGGKLFVNHGLYLRSAMEEVGWADEERYRFYKADGDLCLRMWRAGYEIVDCPDARIEHYAHANERVRASNVAMLDHDRHAYLARWTGIYHDPAGPELRMRVTQEFDDPARTAERFLAEETHG